MIRYFVWFVICQTIYAHSVSSTTSNESENDSEVMVQIHNYNESHSQYKRSINKHRYVGLGGRLYSYHAANTIKIDGTSSVSDHIMDKAANVISLVVRNMPSYVVQGLAKSHGIGIFTTAERITVFPENAKFAAPSHCTHSCSGSCSQYCAGDGRHWQDMGGLTTATKSSVRTDRFLCSTNDNILVHEFAHLVFNFMPETDRQRMYYVYNYVKTHNVWANSYEMTSASEYWAEATSCFFMTNTTPGTYPTGGMNKCDGRVCANEAAARNMLKGWDPWLFNVLSKIYTNNRPDLPSGLTTCV